MFFLFFLFGILAGMCWKYVGMIDNMHKNHPDYKGHDFLKFDDEN